MFKDSLVTGFGNTGLNPAHSCQKYMKLMSETDNVQHKEQVAEVLAVNFRSFVKMHETKYKKSQQVERTYKESLIENVEQKKALIKKNIDLS